MPLRWVFDKVFDRYNIQIMMPIHYKINFLVLLLYNKQTDGNSSAKRRYSVEDNYLYPKWIAPIP